MAESFNHFLKITDGFEESLIDIVEDIADRAVDSIQTEMIANGQVDTGNMLDSVYYSNSHESTYVDGDDYFSEIRGSSNPMKAYVVVAAKYAGYQNYGTRFIPARPFWEPALQTANQNLQQALDDLAEEYTS